MNAVQDFKRYASGIIDAYLIVDRELAVVDFNPLFYQMLPKALARGLKRRRYTEVLQLDIGGDKDIAAACIESGKTMRFDEVRAVIDDKELILIVSATPFPVTDLNTNDGALILIRDVTDEAAIQNKYKQMLEIEANEKAKLAYKITEKSKHLLEANERLNRLQLELMEYKKGLRLI